MSKTKKRPRAERQARNAARVARVAERQESRGRRARLEREYIEARNRYAVAVVIPESMRHPRCICDRCGLEQSIGSGQIWEDGSIDIAGCDHCGHEIGITHEHYEELM